MSNTPRKTTTDKPPAVHFNLDTFETETKREPFTFVFAGKRWTASDPQEVDWQILADMDVTDARQNMQTLLGDQYDEFCTHKVSQGAISALNEAAMKHYGLMNPGEGSGSSRS